MSRNIMSVLPRWSARLFSVELNGAMFYFGLQDKQPPPGSAGPSPALFAAALRSVRGCFSLLVSTSDAIHRARFHSQLRDRLVRELPAECSVFPMGSFLPGVRGSLISGYFVTEADDTGGRTERLLRDLVLHDPVLVCSYSRGKDAQRWTQHVWSGGGQAGMEFIVVFAEEPPCHPSTLNIINSHVFYSVTEAVEVFKKCGDIIPEAVSVLELLPNSVKTREKPDFPVIVVEGLDATGKTTLTESLRDSLGATLLRSPPQCLSPWRARFDQEPPLIRRAFYALGNYITAEQIHREAMKTPVIVDRFWHSTAAYAIATAVSGPTGNLPEAGSEVYLWPPDLLEPSLVVLLSLDPEERKRRLRGRAQGETNEEQELDLNQLFRLRVEEAYRRISGPACVTVDASPSAKKVLQQVLLLVKSQCHF